MYQWSSLRFQMVLAATFVGALVLVLQAGVLGGAAGEAAPLPPIGAPEAGQDAASPGPLASLAEIVNEDGSLRQGNRAPATFDARGWQLTTAPDGSPRFQRIAGDGLPVAANAVTADPDDALWDDRFGTRPGAPIINSVVVSGQELFVGGGFQHIAGVPANGIARWTGTGWTALVSGTDNGVATDGSSYGVNALAISGTELILAGRFERAGGEQANDIARWDGVRFSPLLSGTQNGITDLSFSDVKSLVITGGKVYVGGSFNAAGGLTVSNIAVWDGLRWAALGSGGTEGVAISGGFVASVNALAARGTDLYAGGLFTRAGSVEANNIARWDGVAWSALVSGTANGVTGNSRTVLDIVFRGSEVVAGGSFLSAGGAPANNIARWDGIRWLPVMSGTVNGLTSLGQFPVHALAVISNDVVAAGSFLTAGGRTATNIARWNGTAWLSLPGSGGEGLNSTVEGLAAAGDGVVAVGGFWRAGGNAASGVARWQPPIDIGQGGGGGGVLQGFDAGPAVGSQLFATWSRYAPSPINGPDFGVSAVAISGTDVFIGGSFEYAGLVKASHVARWNGVAWSALLSGTANGVNGRVEALAMSGTTLYAGGRFTEAGGSPASFVASWDGVRWSPLLSGTKNGLDHVGFPQVLALASAPDGIYVGGSFTMAGGNVITSLARWNGTAWSGLLSGTHGIQDGFVAGLAVTGTHVYAAGRIRQAGGITVNSVARWDGVRWSALLSGAIPGVNEFGDVRAIVISGSDVIVGGEFIDAGGLRVDNIARWNGTSWSRLVDVTTGQYGVGGGSFQPVRALAVAKGRLFVGGYLFDAANRPASHIASWDGQHWKALGSGVDGEFSSVQALAATPTDLYVGGSFDVAGNKPAWNFSRWAIAAGGNPSGIGTTVLVPAVVKGYTGGW